jgi:hypothetical protein
MKLVVEKTREKLQALHPPVEPLYSWDNNRTNASADIHKMGLTEEQAVPLPTYSPDMHQIIEHAIAQFKKELAKAVLEHDGQPMTASEAQKLAEDVFKGLDWSGIAANDQKLVCNWQVISTPEGEPVKCIDGKWHTGTGGNYPSADLR